MIGTLFTLFVVPMFYTFISPSDKAWREANERRIAAG
jgi:multidrug efflux pump